MCHKSPRAQIRGIPGGRPAGKYPSDRLETLGRSRQCTSSTGGAPAQLVVEGPASLLVKAACQGGMTEDPGGGFE